MPLTDSRGQGVPYPVLTDRPNARAFGENLVEGLADRLVMRFGSASIRNATITSPREGMVAYLEDTNQLTMYDGARWIQISANPPGGWAYTPVIQGDLSLGTGNVYGRYTLAGSWVSLTVVIRAGDTTAWSGPGNVWISLPIDTTPTVGGETLNFSGTAVFRAAASFKWMGAVTAFSSDNRMSLEVFTDNRLRDPGSVSGLALQDDSWISMQLTYQGV